MSNGKWHMVLVTGRDEYATGYAGFDGTIYSGNKKIYGTHLRKIILYGAHIMKSAENREEQKMKCFEKAKTFA